MKLIDRIFLGIYSFFIAILSVIFILFPLNGKVYRWTCYFLEVYSKDLQNIIIPIIFFIISMRFLISGIKNNSKNNNSVVKHTAYGEINISMETIEGMALKSAKTVHGLRDIKASAHQRNDGIIINMKAFALSDINIPQTAMNIQQRIKEHIETSTGVDVVKVKINIDNIALQSKKRVE